MKQKIKEALKTRAKNLGLDDSAFDGVAAFGETIVKEDAEIEGFVNSEATMNLLKTYQSVADKARAAAIAKNEPTPQPSDNGNNPPEPKPETPDIAAIVAQAVAAAINPLQEKLNAFETAKSAELAVKSAQEKFFADAWVNGYPELRDAAWQQAIDVYEDTERKYTAEQLHEKAMKYFKPLAKAKGLDISKPFQSDGGAGGNSDTDFGAMAQRLRDKGKLPSENKE